MAPAALSGRRLAPASRRLRSPIVRQQRAIQVIILAMTNDDLATRLRRLRAGQPVSAEWVGRTLAALCAAAGAGDTMASAAETLYLPAGAARNAAFVSTGAGGTDGADWQDWADTLAPAAAGHGAVFDHGVAAFRVGDAGLAIIPPFPLPAAAAGRRPGIDDAPLRMLLATEFTVGVALVRLGRYAIAVYEGRRLLASKTDTRYVKSKHHAGGTSQQRFRRVREGQIHRLYTAAGGVLRQQWQPYLRRLDYVALGRRRHHGQRVCERVRHFGAPSADYAAAPPGCAGTQPGGSGGTGRQIALPVSGVSLAAGQPVSRVASTLKPSSRQSVIPMIGHSGRRPAPGFRVMRCRQTGMPRAP